MGNQERGRQASEEEFWGLLLCMVCKNTFPSYGSCIGFPSFARGVDSSKHLRTSMYAKHISTLLYFNRIKIMDGINKKPELKSNTEVMTTFYMYLLINR